jgi:hypothetical protein
MTRFAVALGLLSLLAAPASAQYAVGHRVFGGGTSLGAGYSRMDWQFLDIDPNRPYWLLPTVELKVFLGDALSLDLSVPVVNIAASNAIQKYFFFTTEAYVNFHPSAPSAIELFVAPGVGFSYAGWKSDDGKSTAGAYAFHVPVRIGLEFNNARRTFSVAVALRPFFSLIHGGSGDNGAGGGGIVEVTLMAYMVRYRADRY